MRKPTDHQLTLRGRLHLNYDPGRPGANSDRIPIEDVLRPIERIHARFHRRERMLKHAGRGPAIVALQGGDRPRLAHQHDLIATNADDLAANVGGGV